jgi:hypothetical protein
VVVGVQSRGNHMCAGEHMLLVDQESCSDYLAVGMADPREPRLPLLGG